MNIKKTKYSLLAEFRKIDKDYKELPQWAKDNQKYIQDLKNGKQKD